MRSTGPARLGSAPRSLPDAAQACPGWGNLSFPVPPTARFALICGADCREPAPQTSRCPPGPREPRDDLRPAARRAEGGDGRGAGPGQDPAQDRGTRKRPGGGNAVRFLGLPGAGVDGQTLGGPPRPNGKGHRLCHSATVTPNGPGAKAPGQRTPRQRRALRTRRGLRRPVVSRVATVLTRASRAGGGNAVRFLAPPGVGVGCAEVGFVMRRIVRPLAIRPAPMAKAIAFATVPR